MFGSIFYKSGYQLKRMDEKNYPFQYDRNEFRYEFLSISDEKQVKKVVLFTETRFKTVYNLALLDELENGDLRDDTETKNKDLITVMATVFKIVDDFLTKNPTFFVLFLGSDEKRHRLYRMILNKELPKISKKFKVLGGFENDFSIFEPNMDYEYYLIKKI